MVKNILYVVSALLASTAVMAQCSNGACAAANAIYKECKLRATSVAAFQKCLCTEKFLVNYDRCIHGWVCAWDGNPATLNNPCIALYCPGTFDGGFDAKAFCSGYPPTSTVKTSTVKTSTTKTTKVTLTPYTFTGPIPIETGIA